MDMSRIMDTLLTDLGPLRFEPPVTHVYNPMEYAREPWDLYVKRYGGGRKEVVLLGMNPGPWGMAQTGIPFGEVSVVREWLRIEAPVGTPGSMHPKRPVEGFSCTRSEVSGRRLWGWVRERFSTPQRFFERFFVANYCPLVFMEASGRNRTPNTLRVSEKAPLIEACDRALRDMIGLMKPRYVVGVGRFAETRARAALSDTGVTIGVITHPSPANPRANKGWAPVVEKELAELGVGL